MAGINDLKDNAISIDTTSNNVVSMNNSSPASKHKTIIPAKNKTIVSSQQESTGNRVAVDISTIAKPEEPDPNIHKSIAHDILVGENSPFEQSKRRKIAEAEERLALWDEEQELKEQEEVEKSLEQIESGAKVSSLTDTEEEIKLVSEEDSSYKEIDLDFDDEEDEEMEDTNKEVLENSIDDETVEEVNEVAESEELSESTIVEEESTNEVEENEVIDEEDDELFNDDIVLDSVTTETVSTDNSSKEDDEDMTIVEEDEEEISSDVNQKELLTKLKEQATARLKPIAQQLDIKSFTIAKKPVANTSILNENPTRVAKWVLPEQQSTVKMKEFTGAELELLRQFTADSESLSSINKRYRMIYDHIVSAKPEYYETWTKCTPYADIEHYFFAIYIASFEDANYIPMDCTDKKCKEAFITDNIKIMDMVEFDTKETKNKFKELYSSEVSNSNGLYATEIIPINEKVAIGFKIPTIYNLLEIAALGSDFQQKYSNILDIVPFVDSMYIIDAEQKTLIPIGYKIYTDNAGKTVKSKINKFNKVISTLKADEFGPIRSYILGLREKTSGISYKYPEVTCPKCGNTISSSHASAEE